MPNFLSAEHLAVERRDPVLVLCLGRNLQGRDPCLDFCLEQNGSVQVDEREGAAYARMDFEMVAVFDKEVCRGEPAEIVQCVRATSASTAKTASRAILFSIEQWILRILSPNR